MTIRIGTRGSQLALWQAHYIEKLLNKVDIHAEIVIIQTKGDKILDKALSKIGSKGVFTEALEQQLRDKKIDIAVHSAKDVPSTLTEDLPLLAFTEREIVNDVLVSFDSAAHLNEKSLIVGTSSTRRVALLRHFYPQVQTVDMRGNLQTRLRKLKEGQCQALILAYAGVHRMNYHAHITQRLSLDEFTPAVGQGSIAVQIHDSLSDEKRNRLAQAINHLPTAICLQAERAFLRTLQGGCSIPVFGLATWQGEEIHLTGGIISLDGKKLIKETLVGEAKQATQIGKTLATQLLDKGGAQILAEIKVIQNS
ncbi:MAG: hydroxymethylbilane synthase [Bacteroidota bacterium]